MPGKCCRAFVEVGPPWNIKGAVEELMDQHIHVRYPVVPQKLTLNGIIEPAERAEGIRFSDVYVVALFL
jgi:hypothetical protein